MQGMTGVLGHSWLNSLEMLGTVEDAIKELLPFYGECLRSSDDIWKLLDGEDISFGYFGTSFELDLGWILMDSMC